MPDQQPVVGEQGQNTGGRWEILMLEAPAISPWADLRLMVSETRLLKTRFLKKSCTARRFSLSSSGSRKMGSGSNFLQVHATATGHRRSMLSHMQGRLYSTMEASLSTTRSPRIMLLSSQWLSILRLCVTGLIYHFRTLASRVSPVHLNCKGEHFVGDCVNTCERHFLK